MIIEELHLGITRNCSLYCEHCLRGEKECVNISLETLDNLFRDVSEVKTLLITGGEPLIAIQQLERLVQIIKDKGIKVGFIRMITNGTIMSARILRVLKSLREISDLDIKVSANIFHSLELERLGFTELRDKNFEVLRDCFGAEWYGEEAKDHSENIKQLLEYKGRTKTLTEERLAEINEMVSHKYITSEAYGGILTRKGKRLAICDDTILGQLTVDVHGNIVSYGLEFTEEDAESQKRRLNINEMSLREAALEFIRTQDDENDYDAKTLAKKY